jgi:hypothetical protein
MNYFIDKYPTSYANNSDDDGDDTESGDGGNSDELS